jgi:hypothetical protein
MPSAPDHSASPGATTVAPPTAPALPSPPSNLADIPRRIWLEVQRSGPAGLDLRGLDRQDSLDGVWSLDGNVDDGRGPARLYVTVSPANPAASYQQHPCNDPEFRAGARCLETTLGDGSILSIQGVGRYEGFRSSHVLLLHPDGSAVSAEVVNASIPPEPAYITPTSKPMMTITREQPVLTPTALAALVRAVDSATR